MFDAMLSRVQTTTHRFTVYADSDDSTAEDWFANHSVDVDRQPLPEGGPDPFVSVERRGEFAGVLPLVLIDRLLEPPVVRPDGWYETKIFKNYSTLSEFQSVCRENNIEVELHSITSGHAGSEDSPAYGLTERQHEALTLALSRGYYESPRRTSTDALADELDITQPSMSDLLRRAEHQILSSTLGSQTRVEVPSP